VRHGIISIIAVIIKLAAWIFQASAAGGSEDLA
jgi:hypothetical protein